MAKRKTRPLAGKRGSSEEPEVKTRSRAPATAIRWWTEERGEKAQASLWAWVDRLRSTWSQDAINDLIAEAIYQDTPITANSRYNGTAWTGAASAMNPLNAIKSLVDTATARLTKLRSMPCISADDADYEEQDFATEKSRVLRRKMGNGDMEVAASLICRDFIVRGTAVGLVDRVGGDTEFKRIPIYEIVYDKRECQHGPPQSLARVYSEDRETLKLRYPKRAEQVRRAPAYARQDPWLAMTYMGPSLSDRVEVAESWHPPSGPDADDGQHIVCVRGAVVARSPWNCPRYPVNFVHWTAPFNHAPRGTGLVTEMAPAQDFINDILSDARDGIRDGSQLKIFQPQGGGSNKHHLRAKGPAVVEYQGAKPEYIAPNPVSQQAWNIAFQVLDEMFNLSGISRWAASSKSPLGEGVSGKALDTMNDNQSDRFAHVETGYQQWRVGVGVRHVDRARMMHDEANGKVEKIYDEQPDPITKDGLAAWICDNEWPDVQIDGGNYHLVLEPANYLADSREGRLEDAGELSKAGLIPDPSMTAGLFSEPDMQAMNRPILGPLHRIQQCMSALRKPEAKAHYIDYAPDQFMNLPLAELICKGELEHAKSKNAKPETIERFMNFLSDVKAQSDKKTSSASLAGAQASTTVAQPNATTLQGGTGMPPPMPGGDPTGGGGAPPMPPPPMPPQ